MAHPPPYDPYYGHKEFNNGINTLFVSGLPDDIKAREIHNLFRRRPGFDSCQLKYTGRGNQVVAFATFFNHQSAVSALHSLNGVKFDPQTGSTLHIELARSNSRTKRKPGTGAYVVVDHRKKEDNNSNNNNNNENNDNNNTQENSSDDEESESDEQSDTEDQESSDKEEEELITSNVSLGDNPVDSDNLASTVNQQTEKTGEGNQCSTLFIANLGPDCTEDELMEILSNYPGFNVLKLRIRGGVPVAFADFQEIEQANKAMEELTGTILPSSDHGGIHIEYARSKMRKT